MLLSDYRPHAKLVTKKTLVDKPRFKVIDAHNHLGEDFGGGWDKKPINELLDLLDTAGITKYIDLDGGWGEEILHAHLDYFKSKAPDRFQVFGGVDWSQWQTLGNRFPEWASKRIAVQKEAGAQGIKIWKPFGLQIKDPQGNLVKVDDIRLSPIWETAGELKLPIMVHVADPVAFFDPIDETNERWEELNNHPDWAFTSPPYPPFMEILNGLQNLVSLHPSTVFIGAHVGCYAENLDWVGKMLDRCSNYFIDISARTAELGRQPFTARKFFMNYQDRILFGSDLGPDLEAYRAYFRFLETDDEYFNYGTSEIPEQGRWQVYGLNLPEDVLKKVYFSNANRILNHDN
jgi:predicted TIM-barrel fold metal-dependent hydrolase